MAGLARRLAPAAALGGLAVIIVGVADPVFAGRSDPTATTTTQEQVSQDQATTEAARPEGTVAPEAATAPQETAAPEAAAADATSCDQGEQVTGDAVMTQWGPVQVAATVAGGQVCQVYAVEWPQNDRKSQMINAQAIPQLDAMASEGTTFDYVSGATYTSDAYAQSLQSLLDAL